jgi:hypothetical protein
LKLLYQFNALVGPQHQESKQNLNALPINDELRIWQQLTDSLYFFIGDRIGQPQPSGLYLTDGIRYLYITSEINFKGDSFLRMNKKRKE